MERNSDAKLDDRLDIATQITRGVQFIHDNQMIHGDIHPSNILVCLKRGKTILKIGDLGLSKSKATEANSVKPDGLGHDWYLAPELSCVRRDGVLLPQQTPQDVYSTGLVLHFVFTNVKSPFGTENVEIQRNKAQGLANLDVLNNICQKRPAIIDIIQKMIDLDPTKRPDMDEVLDVFFNEDDMIIVGSIVLYQNRVVGESISSVFEGKYLGKNDVAVKKVAKRSNVRDKEKLKREIDVLKALQKHQESDPCDNLIQLYGYERDKDFW